MTGVQTCALPIWRPVTGAPRGVLVIHHGLADHGARYAGLAEPLVRAGFAVWALDMRGHGRSAGARASSPSIDAFLDDLDAFLREVRAAEPGRPVFLMGHSLGGLITARYATRRRCRPARSAWSPGSTPTRRCSRRPTATSRRTRR